MLIKIFVQWGVYVGREICNALCSGKRAQDYKRVFHRSSTVDGYHVQSEKSLSLLQLPFPSTKDLLWSSKNQK